MKIRVGRYYASPDTIHKKYIYITKAYGKDLYEATMWNWGGSQDEHRSLPGYQVRDARYREMSELQVLLTPELQEPSKSVQITHKEPIK